MLKELFESSFFLVYPIKGNTTPCLLQSEKKGSFSLIDETACASCRPCCNKDGQREQLCLFSNDSVNILKLNQVFGLLQDSYDNCDFVLDDHQVFMLLEMKCCQAKYYESLRCKARNQLYHTIYLLKNVPVINKHIFNSKKKYVIFSWKMTSDNDNNNGDMVSVNMSDMTSFVDETYSINNESYFDNGFYYKEVRYPDILNWDNLKNI